MFDGKVPHWHHFSCFWQRAAAQSTSDIGGFSDLRWDDQEKVKKAIESGGSVGGGRALDIFHSITEMYRHKLVYRLRAHFLSKQERATPRVALKEKKRWMNLQWNMPNQTGARVKAASRR